MCLLLDKHAPFPLEFRHRLFHVAFDRRRADEFPLRTSIPWSQDWEIQIDGTTEWKPIDAGDSWNQSWA